MTAPIIVYKPKLLIQPLDENGDPDGSPVDVTADITSVEIGVSTPTTTVSTFVGKFQVPGDIEESAKVSCTINADTDDNWSALVGISVEMQVYDRQDASRYRAFQTIIPANPSLYGSTAPGQPRTADMDVPVLSPIEWVTVVPGS